MKKFTTLLLFILAMLVSTNASAATANRANTTVGIQDTDPAISQTASTAVDATVCVTEEPQAATDNKSDNARQDLVAENKVQKESKKNNKKKNANNILVELEYDEDNERMGVEVKEKRQSDKFIDTNHVTKLLLAFFINFIAIMIVVRWLYYPRCKRGEFFFTYILIAISTFMLIYVLGDVKLKAGIALGLFAMFSIIRYRTEQIAIREMTYLFIIIALSAINGLTISELSIGEVIIINILFIITTWICETKLLISHYSYKVIKYDNINLITPDKREELIADLEKRTGLKVIKVEVGAIDFLKDAAIVKMYYKSNEANNSVDTTLKAPTDEYKLK